MAVVAVGFFDGVHLGHREILRGADVALTFENHPLSVLAPEKAPRLIMTRDGREKAITALGVGQVTAIDFTEELANSSPEDFLKRLERLAGPDRLSVRCGENWRFGKGGAANADWLRARGVEVTVVPYAVYDGAPVSSTRIRSALAAGDLVAANAMLGSRYAIEGEIFAGKGEGAKLGFPTVNVRIAAAGLALPPLGVYEVEVAGARALANFGVAPTFGDRAWSEPVIELHFVREVPRLEEKRARVEFLRFIRPERRFGSIAELRAQISSDLSSVT